MTCLVLLPEKKRDDSIAIPDTLADDPPTSSVFDEKKKSNPADIPANDVQTSSVFDETKKESNLSAAKQDDTSTRKVSSCLDEQVLTQLKSFTLRNLLSLCGVHRFVVTLETQMILLTFSRGILQKNGRPAPLQRAIKEKKE